jgi:hypothetical protein
MTRVGSEFMIPGFERAKTVHALDLAATVIGVIHINEYNFESSLHNFLNSVIR